MASPQKENGFTAIANEIYEALLRVALTDTQHRVLHTIIRKTYGFHKKEDRISISQICALTGISRRAVFYSLQNLEAKRMIRSTKGSGSAGRYSFQKDYSLWIAKAITKAYAAEAGKWKKAVHRETIIIKREVPVDKSVDKSEKIGPQGCNTLHRGGAIPCTGGVQYLAPTKDIIKDISKDKIPPPAAARSVNNSPKNLVLKQSMDRALTLGLNIYALLAKLRGERGWPADKMFPEEVILEICRDFERRHKYIKNPWPYFKKALSLKCDQWMAEQQIRESAIYKQEVPWLTIEGILAMAGKVEDGKNE